MSLFFFFLVMKFLILLQKTCVTTEKLLKVCFNEKGFRSFVFPWPALHNWLSESRVSGRNEVWDSSSHAVSNKGDTIKQDKPRSGNPNQELQS